MMAYFGSNYYEAEPGVYLPIPYGDSYDSVSRHHALTSYSCYESHADPFVGAYDPALTSYSCYESHADPFVGAYDPALSRSVISYSVSTGSRSELVVYDPFHTQITISYNKSGFNEPDYEEYDPTPYGGGYDIDQTYGKPLPPSVEICYPQHAPPAIPPPPPSGEKEEDHGTALEPQKGSPPAKDDKEEIVKEEQEEPLGSSQSGETEGNYSYYDDYYPWTGYEYDYGNGRRDNHECEKQVAQAPWGYSPEAMEFCESIFGHWPCLYRQKKYGDQGTTNEDRNSNQWKGTADFLFGNSYPFTHQSDGGGSQGDAKHYQEQPYYLQIENEKNPW